MSEVKVKRLINFETESSVKNIQKYADKNFDGNFTKAVRKLSAKALESMKDSEEK